MTDEQLIKKAFAYEWLKDPKNAYKAALSVTQNDTFSAMQMVTKWSHDPEVIQFKKDLMLEYGEEHFMPSRYELVHDVLENARRDPFADVPKSYKLIADMLGYIEKPGITINNTSTTNNKVMVIPATQLNDNGTTNLDAWQQNAISQQDEIVQGQVA